MSECQHDNMITFTWDVDWCPDCGAIAKHGGDGWQIPEREKREDTSQLTTEGEGS